MSMRIEAWLFNFIPAAVKQGLLMLPPVRRMNDGLLQLPSGWRTTSTPLPCRAPTTKPALMTFGMTATP